MSEQPSSAHWQLQNIVTGLRGAREQWRTRNGRSIGVRGVHAQLEQLDIPLSFLSVREVLKRLCTEGVIELGNDKCYSLNPQARAVLEQTHTR